eukprot:1863706-Karenia_brevis.AAC.1
MYYPFWNIPMGQSSIICPFASLDTQYLGTAATVGELESSYRAHPRAALMHVIACDEPPPS